MTSAALQDVVAYLDTLLEVRATPDYPQAVNGLQLANAGKVTSVAAAVDFSSAAVDGAIAAGADLLLLECVPATLATDISAALEIPVIGIGTGAACDGQVLVLHDALGVSTQAPPFAPDFLKGRGSVEEAVKAYVAAVKSGAFP